MTQNHTKSRTFSKKDFEQAYQATILNNNFFEKDSYYIQQKPRYFNTLKLICECAIPKHAKILEFGGGQLAILMKELFDDESTVGDVNETYKQGLLDNGIEFKCCDLLHDDITERDVYDLVIMCEVIEHMPIPPHIVLEKIKAAIKPGGLIFITTPNLYRFRNLVRLALGLHVFDTFLIPERGKFIGHPFEYSAKHLTWQIEKAGFKLLKIEFKQLANAGATVWTQLGRIIASPLLLRPIWRDQLVAIAQKPHNPVV